MANSRFPRRQPGGTADHHRAHGERGHRGEGGTSEYPYREIEYGCTYRLPPADSLAVFLASSFLTYLARGNGQDVIRTHGHLPCWTPEGPTLCARD